MADGLPLWQQFRDLRARFRQVNKSFGASRYSKVTHMSDLDGAPAELAASLLTSLGVPSSPLQVADGASNRV